MHVEVNGGSLDLEQVAAVARGRARARLGEAARGRMEASLGWVRDALEGRLAQPDLPVYGVNTGYGSLARVRLPGSAAQELSWNLIQSHAAGVGPPVPIEAVRAMMLLRANALSKGASGCRPALVETLLAMLDQQVTPVVPSRGSCGSSGDLAPLAHLGLVVFRGPAPEPSGEAYWGELRMTGAEAMARAGIERLVPWAKDGLAMTNGAQLTTAITALTAYDAWRLLRLAVLAAAASWEALRGVRRALHPAVHALRPHPGAVAVAGALRALLNGSTLVDSLPDKVQDAYSLRCAPVVLGAVHDALRYVSGVVQVEINAATDNPLILVDEPGENKAFSAGLFHGEPVGFAADHLKLALCEVASLAERRIYRMTTGLLSSRLPPLLVGDDRPGLGLMMPQTQAAALVAANRQMAFPCSVDSLPTCEDQEDHVAMSTTAARQARAVLENTRQVVAIELLAAWQALLLRGDAQLGVGTRVFKDYLEAHLPRYEAPGDTLEALMGQLDGLLAAVEATGALAGVGHA